MPSQNTIHFTPLTEWMRDNQETFRSLSEKTGIDKMTLSRLANGKLKRLNPRIIAKLAEVTGNKISEPEFIAFFANLSTKVAA